MRLTVFNEICKPDEALMHNPFNHLINIFHSENLWVVSLVFSNEIYLFEIIQRQTFTDILICENFTPLCGGLQ
jgi:hypothetical protein